MTLENVVVSVINYKTADMTMAAVTSLLEDVGTRAIRVIIVDNASGDGSVETLQAWIDTMGDARVTLIASQTNAGFSGGHNLAVAAEPDADAYLILNSDTLICAGFWDAILQAFDAHPKAGLLVPWLEWEDRTPQENCFRPHSTLSELIRGAASGPVTKLLKKHELVLPVPPEPEDIAWASFACVLLRGEMVRQIGPMDDGYFMYYEDAEYCLRAARNGWPIHFVHDAKVIHFEGGSGPVQALDIARDRMPAYYWHSRARYLRQAHGSLGFFAGNLGWYLGRAIAHLRLVAGKRVPSARKYEWMDIWRGTFRPVTKVQPRR